MVRLGPGSSDNPYVHTFVSDRVTCYGDRSFRVRVQGEYSYGGPWQAWPGKNVMTESGNNVMTARGPNVVTLRPLTALP